MEAIQTHTLTFPENSGFEKTDIFFYSGSPDLRSLYFNGNETDAPMRLFVTDETIAQLSAFDSFTQDFHDGKDFLTVLPAGERFKDITHVLDIVRVALEHNFDRGCLFIAIGGGVICDMTGFAASMFKRGVSVEFVPTTLLAMVDASVGGKTGCDFDGYKNMIGAFYPAKALHVWPSFVQSLPEHEYRSGLAEAVKTAFLFLPETAQLFLQNENLINQRDSKTLQTVITSCVQAKASVVHKDLREKGDRAFLNLGHTFGHALETVAGLGKITHGEAVAWGMARAADLSYALGLCSKDYVQNAKEILRMYGYDTEPKPLLAHDILNAMKKDKKNKAEGALRVIIQKDFAENEIRDVTEQEVMQVLK